MNHHRPLSLLILALIAVYSSDIWIPKAKGEVLGASTSTEIEYSSPVKTITAFDQREDVVVEEIPYETEYKDDNDTEYGTEKVLEAGKNGTRTLTYLITSWGDEEIDRQLTDTKIDEPKSEVIAKGTKIVWRELDTPDAGGVWYWYKFEVWATKYDANCVGCTGRTYSGTEVVKGVCATDPRVIKLGTNFYVEGYGLCRAEDIGGAIKGDKIDLGYEDASKGAWRTGYTTVYLITNAPDGSSKY
jgi:3D (Asp-Asp-Asp) domain-containing protein